MKINIRFALLLFTLLFFAKGTLFADRGLTLSGTVKDAQSGENLIGVVFYITGNSCFCGKRTSKSTGIDIRNSYF